MKNDIDDVLKQLKNQLIVSCQALEHEPLHGSHIMGRMAVAAMEGGAKGIRANGIADIQEIKRQVKLPIIGIIKAVYDHSDVYITPTMKEVDLLYNEGVDVIALDATDRIRPGGTTIDEIFPVMREKYPNQLFMADCATYEDAILAEKLGFDCIATTLRGCTEATKNVIVPDMDYIKKVVDAIALPIIAEGGIWTSEHLKNVFQLGVHGAVIGSAITRPQLITKYFVEEII